MHLAGFIIRIYQVARSPERQTVHFYIINKIICTTAAVLDFWLHS